MSDRPQARVEDLIVEDLDGGVVVYDRRNCTAHWLDASAASVWRMADGQRAVQQIARECDLSEPTVADVLLRLHGLELMAEKAGTGMPRRAALSRMARIGGAAILAPVISSVVVPNALAASSVPHCVTAVLGNSTPAFISIGSGSSTGFQIFGTICNGCTAAVLPHLHSVTIQVPFTLSGTGVSGLNCDMSRSYGQLAGTCSVSPPTGGTSGTVTLTLNLGTFSTNWTPGHCQSVPWVYVGLQNGPNGGMITLGTATVTAFS